MLYLKLPRGWLYSSGCCYIINSQTNVVIAEEMEKTMAINKAMRALLKVMSYGGVDVEASRHIANLKALNPMKLFYRKIDFKIYNEDYEVPIRVFLPDEEVIGKEKHLHTLLFLHGGGWITESVDNYNRVCASMARATGCAVVAVEYRLAPEYRFPVGLEDCYAVAKALYTNRFILNVDPEEITLVGDSAGGNLAAALSLMAKERGEFLPKRQILIYPAVNNDYTETSPFPSVHDNGEDFLLTALKIQQYQQLYKCKDEDLMNPYFAPLLAKDLSGQPETLIITAEYDPLRDEGEAYGKRLKAAGNTVEIHRIKGALHGYFALGIKYYHVQESFEIINEFLKEC